MFNKILVALDHTEVSPQLFADALRLAQPLGAQLMLLHVLSNEDADSPYLPLRKVVDQNEPTIPEESLWQTYNHQWEVYEQRSLEQLKQEAAAAIAQGVPTEFSQQLGIPGQTICDLAKHWAADLILVGNRGRRGLTELVLGSVSNYVMHHAPCSVLVVNRNTLTTSLEKADVTEGEVAQISRVT